MSTQMRTHRQVPMDPEVVRRMRSTKRYQRWRSEILRKEPLCRACSEAGFTVGAEHIDHIEPVHLSPERFWDRDNVRPIFRDCHERKHAGQRAGSGAGANDVRTVPAATEAGAGATGDSAPGVADEALSVPCKANGATCRKACYVHVGTVG